jgi:hypothetical protein
MAVIEGTATLKTYSRRVRFRRRRRRDLHDRAPLERRADSRAARTSSAAMLDRPDRVHHGHRRHGALQVEAANDIVARPSSRARRTRRLASRASSPSARVRRPSRRPPRARRPSSSRPAPSPPARVGSCSSTARRFTMPVEWNRGATAQSPLVADRNLYLDASGNKSSRRGTPLRLAARRGRASDQPGRRRPAGPRHEGRPGRAGPRRQDRGAPAAGRPAGRNSTPSTTRSSSTRRENSTKDIPNTMEAARVALETRYEHAVLALNQFKKAGAGKDPLRGESQATSLEPEKSETAREATKQANAAVSASPSPVDLAKERARAERRPKVAPQHPPTTEGAERPHRSSGAGRDNPSKVLTEAGRQVGEEITGQAEEGVMRGSPRLTRGPEDVSGRCAHVRR